MGENATPTRNYQTPGCKKRRCLVARYAILFIGAVAEFFFVFSEAVQAPATVAVLTTFPINCAKVTETLFTIVVLAFNATLAFEAVSAIVVIA